MIFSFSLMLFQKHNPHSSTLLSPSLTCSYYNGLLEVNITSTFPSQIFAPCCSHSQNSLPQNIYIACALSISIPQLYHFRKILPYTIYKIVTFSPHQNLFLIYPALLSNPLQTLNGCLLNEYMFCTYHMFLSSLINLL